MTEKKTLLRARNSQDKASRRDHILKQSFELLKKDDWDQISMEALAQKSGLAKGTLYLYFRTKEEVFLACTQRLFRQWIDSYLAALRASDHIFSAKRFSEVFTEHLCQQSELPRFLSSLHLALENNASGDSVDQYKIDLRAKLLNLSQALVNKTPGLSSSDLALSFMIKSHSLIVGLYQVCKSPKTDLFRLNFEEQLQESLEILLLGFEKSTRNSSYHIFGNY